jgi:hypothetical protein
MCLRPKASVLQRTFKGGVLGNSPALLLLTIDVFIICAGHSFETHRVSGDAADFFCAINSRTSSKSFCLNTFDSHSVEALFVPFSLDVHRHGMDGE